MKKINLFIILFLILVGCEPKDKVVDQSYYYEQIINDLNAQVVAAQDSIVVLNNIIVAKEEAYNTTLENLKMCDSSNVNLKAELFVANYKLGRIKEYSDIVKRNPSQVKFLRGWINRVLED